MGKKSGAIGRATPSKRRARPDRVKVCVAAIVLDRRGRFLLLRRGPGSTWPGTWCFPGGHVEPGEGLRECCRRELREETGLDYGPAPSAFGFEGVTEVIARGDHHVGVMFRCHVRPPEAGPVNAEPDRHDAIGWFDWGSFPGPLMPVVESWRQGDYLR